MRRTAAGAVLATLLVAGGCSSSGRAGPAVSPARLKALLVTGADVRLPGYTATTPDGEQLSRTTIAIRYFNRAGFTDTGLHSSDVANQLSVSLVATSGATPARAAADEAVTAAVEGLRAPVSPMPTTLGSHGRVVVGRAKGDGAQQHGVYFVEGDVAVSVILSAAAGQPGSLALEVARAQDAKLRKAG